MKNVLVPVDGSESAMRAVRWISSLLAGQPGAHVDLVHVQPSADAWQVRSHLSAQDIAGIQASNAAGVLDPAAEIVRAAGVPVDTHVVVGEIANAVAEQ